MKSMEILIGMFAMVINKLTPTKKEISSIPSHRWEVYTNNSLQRGKQILSDIAYCRDLQNRREKR